MSTDLVADFKQLYGGEFKVTRTEDEIIEAALIHCKWSEEGGFTESESQALLAAASALMWVLDRSLEPGKSNPVESIVAIGRRKDEREKLRSAVHGKHQPDHDGG